jgi:hypothetical protein
MLTKEQRAAISRANGAKSRGPKTLEGKVVSSRNALKHGLTARRIVIEGLESEKEFQRFTAVMRSHYKPRNIEEALWVDRITTCMWRARRVALEEASLTEEANGQDFCKTRERYLPKDTSKLELLMTYEERLMRQVQVAIRELEKLRGSESLPASLPQPSISVVIREPGSE